MSHLPIPSLVLEAAEQLLNAYVRLDPIGLENLAQFYGKVLELNIEGLGLQLYFFPGADGFQLAQDYQGQADAIISGTPAGLMRLQQAENFMQELPATGVRIEGDKQLAQLFQTIKIDWEEWLSKLIGDIGAFEIGKTARRGQRWLARGTQSARDNLKEYLQEEQRDLPPREEVDHFLAQVDDLRDDVARLEARINLLHHASQPKA